MSVDLNLKIGKPNSCEKDPVATYSRFVLPFAFKLQTISNISRPNSLFYKLNDKKDLSYIKRKKYFTRETADTLYERGQWLTMCDAWNQTTWGKAEITVILRDKPFKIGMLPPQITLFEVPEIKHQNETNILQTGCLYVDLYFPEQQDNPPQLDDLLVLNEFFRYFGLPYDYHENIFKNIFSEVPVSPLSNKAIGSLEPLECYFERWAALLDIPLEFNGQYYQFFTQEWADSAKDWMYNKPRSTNLEHWQIYADNRCYVWTVAFLKKGGKTLKTCFEPTNADLIASDYGHWIKLLNIDNPPFNFELRKYKDPQVTHKSITKFERKWANDRTYKRWETDGTWYGFCHHGAAILAPPKEMIFFPSTTYYFDTTLMLLYIRMTLFRFGRELSKVMQENLDNQGNKKQAQQQNVTMEKLRQLRRQFSEFTVLYRFPLLSNQQQAIEMYEINREFLDIEQFFKETKQKIENTHEFLELVESNNLASSANLLASWGIPLALGGLITALLSMEDRNIWQCGFSIKNCVINSDLIFQSVAIVVLVIVSVNFFRRQHKK